MMSVSDLVNWFTGGSHQYHDLFHCMSQDRIWIATTIILDLAVAGGYIVIAAQWGKQEKAVRPSPSKTALGRLKKIFIFCGLCGYIFIPVKMFWPAWRLYDIFLAVLVYYTWRYALGAADIKAIYRELQRSERLETELNLSHSERALLETRVREPQFRIGICQRVAS